MFATGAKVRLIEKSTGKAEVYNVIEDKRSKIILEQDGHEMTFAYKPESGGWKRFFPNSSFQPYSGLVYEINIIEPVKDPVFAAAMNSH